jgi:hypothetical protein
MWWLFPDPLHPCNKTLFNITAHVNGPACSKDYNFVKVEGACIYMKLVNDKDWYWVHCKEKSREINNPFLRFLQSYYPNLFRIIEKLLLRLGL